MQRRLPPLEWFLLVTILAIALLAARYVPAEAPPKASSIEDLVTVSLSILGIVLMLERAIEAYVSLFREPGRRKLREILDTWSSEGSSYGEGNESGSQQARLAQQETELRLWEYSEGTRRLTLALGVVFSAALAVGGVSTLRSFVDIYGVSVFQCQLLLVLDVLLTIGVLVGGSQGVHTIAVRVLGLLQSRGGGPEADNPPLHRTAGAAGEG
jgi:hypothetical protein